MGIILNPVNPNLMSALDSEFNYEVEIDKKLLKRKVFIKTVPEYLFFNINRAQFERKGNQLLKNTEKMSFDFVIYLDRYMDKNKEEEKVMNPIIIDLRKRKN